MTTFCGDGVMYLLCLDVVDVAIGVKDCYDSIVDLVPSLVALAFLMLTVPVANT